MALRSLRLQPLPSTPPSPRSLMCVHHPFSFPPCFSEGTTSGIVSCQPYASTAHPSPPAARRGAKSSYISSLRPSQPGPEPATRRRLLHRLAHVHLASTLALQGNDAWITSGIPPSVDLVNSSQTQGCLPWRRSLNDKQQDQTPSMRTDEFQRFSKECNLKDQVLRHCRP